MKKAVDVSYIDYDLYHDFIEGSIKTLAWQLVRRGFYKRSERDDIAQEMKIHLLRNWNYFDETRSTEGGRKGHIYGNLRHAALALKEKRIAEWEQREARELAQDAHYVRKSERPRLHLLFKTGYRQLTVPAQVLLYAMQLQDLANVRAVCDLSRRKWQDMMDCFRRELGFVGIEPPPKADPGKCVSARKPDLKYYCSEHFVGCMRLLQKPSFEFFEKCPQQQVLISRLMAAYGTRFSKKFPWQQTVKEMGIECNKRSEKVILKQFNKKLLKQVADIYYSIDTILARKDPDPHHVSGVDVTLRKLDAGEVFLNAIRVKMNNHLAMSDVIGGEYLEQCPEMLMARVMTDQLERKQMFLGILTCIKEAGSDREEDLQMIYDYFCPEDLDLPEDCVKWVREL